MENQVAVYFWQPRKNNPNGGRWVKRYHHQDQVEHALNEYHCYYDHIIVGQQPTFPDYHPETGETLKKIDGMVITY